MKKELKITKRTAFILILVLVSAVVLGVGIKDRLSQQGGDGNYVAPTPTPESASVWDVFDDEEPAAGNESGEQERYSIAILYGSMIGTRAAMIVKPISG